MEKIIYKKSFVSAKTNLPVFSAKKASKTNQNNISIIQSKHVRNKTEPKIVLNNETATKPISQYFEESLELLNTIHYYLDLSAENNNKPLVYVSNKKKKKSKISKEIKKQIENEIVMESNERKETYKRLFESIDQSLDTIKQNLVEKVELVNESEEEEISNIIKLSTIKDDESKKENCNASESIINELESQNTITYDDSVDEENSVNKFPNMILSKNVLNPSLKNLNSKYTNMSTNVTTQNETKQENINNKVCLIF